MNHVRRATPQDIPLILTLIRDLAAYEREPNAVDATPAMLEKHLFGIGAEQSDSPGRIAECLIGEIDGAPQGFAVFFHNFSTWRGRPGVYLEDLFVRPDARGSGLGKALLHRVAQLAVDRGCVRMEWVVLDWNEPAIRFYTAHGATPLNEWTVWRLSDESLKRFASTGA